MRLTPITKLLRALLTNSREQALLYVIDLLQEQVQVLELQHQATGRRLLLTDEQRRKIAAIAQGCKRIIVIMRRDV